jgi:hypothetical protein
MDDIQDISDYRSETTMNVDWAWFLADIKPM